MSNDPFSKLNVLSQKGLIPEKFYNILKIFCEGYKTELENHGISLEQKLPILEVYLEKIKEQLQNPYAFQSFHRQILAPFDYYTFGIEFLRPLVDVKLSSSLGLEYAALISEQLKKKENVILFANHQIEADPQAISLLLEKTYPDLARNMIFVAGDRVVTDPLAVPFSLGRNLLCIYSKRYIDHPPEQKLNKQLHNKKTMQVMKDLLCEGGQIIYVAPSGGRDRPNKQGIVEVAAFDPQSIEMFYLMAKRASKSTHFYTLALSTYDLLPPPETIQVELGEIRQTKRGAIHLCFGPEIDMENFPGSENQDKHKKREARANFVWNQVKKDYSKF